jgi:uncharacterized coiled-coil protein SlyX
MNDQEKSEQHRCWINYCKCALEAAHENGRRSRDQELSQLKLDRSAFAEETQRYRDAWLSDQKELSQLKEKLEISESFNENVIAECDAQIERLKKQVDIATDCLDSMTETVHPIHPANKWADVALEKMKAAEGDKT